MIASAEHARTVLVDQADAFEKGPVIRKYSRPVLGDGLVAVDTARHRGRRRIVTQAFGGSYEPIMEALARETVDGWRDGAVLDLGQEMIRLTSRIIGRVLFSVDLVDSALSDAFTVVLRHVTAQIARPLPLPMSLGTRRAMGVLDGAIFDLIAERRREPGRHADVLASLTAAQDEEGRPLGDRHIRDEVMTMFLAGHETSANALTWALHLLLGDPAALERFDVDDAPFSARVFQEALRLYPPVHSLGRQSTREVALGRYRLPRGGIVIVSPLLMHRRPEYFERPDAFEPDRFLSPPARYTYLPFGAGPRACLGGQFATSEAAIIFSAMRAVRLQPYEPTPVVPEMLVTLRPSAPVRARVIRRS